MDHEFAQRDREERSRRRDIIDGMDLIPEDMDLNDGIILLELVNDIRKQSICRHILDLSEYWSEVIKDYKVDSDGRITKLRLCGFIFRGNWVSFILSPIIERLLKLREITLEMCRLIPIEIGNLPFLDRIRFVACLQELSENIPEDLRLNGLKSIGLRADEFFSPRMFALITNHMRSLEELSIGWSENVSDQILRAVLDENLSFRHSLMRLTIFGCELKENDVEKLLFVALSQCRNLRVINVQLNDIVSLQSIEKRIKEPGTLIPENRLKTLDIFKGNGIDLSNSKETEALLTILDTFNEISSFGKYYTEFLTRPEIDYKLKINRAGRKYILNGVGNNGGSNVLGTKTTTRYSSDINNSSIDYSSLPPTSSIKIIKPELWPTIVHRVSDCATGIYFCIRNGSILQDIIAAKQQPQDTFFV